MDKASKRRILVFSTAYLPFIGGAELALKEIALRLQDDFEFDLVTARLDKKLPIAEKIGNINVFRVGEGNRFDKLLFPFKGFNVASKLHDERKYSLVFSLMASYGGVASWKFKKKFPEVPLLINLQEGRNFEKTGRLKMFAFKMILRLADSITAISNYLKDIAVKNGADSEAIKIIPNGVDIEKYSKEFSYGEISDLKNHLGIRPDDEIIISVSRLNYKNGVDTLIKAMPYLDKNYKLLLVGDGEEKMGLVDTAKMLRVLDRIIFTGSIENDVLPKFLSIADAFARPSRSEGLGTAFLEAMAARVPVVATPVGGIVDFIKSAETGVFCAVDNPKSVADKIKIVVEDKKLREQLIKNAYKLVKEKYDWNKIADEYREILNKIIIPKS
ncbi:MAG: glycosyltransferase family 4 protein [bacterium]|nr:glycosyltransferase family 4 protein [bacterium]